MRADALTRDRGSEEARTQSDDWASLAWEVVTTRKGGRVEAISTDAVAFAGYAALSLPKKSVRTRQIRNASINTAKLKNGAVTKAKLNLTGVTVPAARTAGTATTAISATSATHASSADNATSAQTLAAPEAIRLVGAPGDPGFQNLWLNHGGSADEPAGFYKDQEGIVHLQGQVVDGSGVIFQLPPGDRPDSGKVLRVPAAACDCLKSLPDP